MANYADPTVVAMEQGSQPRVGPVLILAAGVIALLIVGLFYLRVYQVNKDKDALTSQIAQENGQLEQLKPVATDLASMTNQSKELHALFDNQKRWEEVMSSLAAHLYKHIRITSLQLNDKGLLDMAGVVQDYTQYAQLYATLTGSDFSNYFASVQPTTLTKVKQGSGNGYEVDFGFHIQLTPAAINNPITVLPFLTTIPSSTPTP